jgi:hypothetical protein
MEPSNELILSAKIAQQCRNPELGNDRRPNPRTLRALDNIVWACDKLDSLKQRISLSAVGVLTKGVDGGPTRGGLRNSKTFSAYVKARASEQGVTSNEDRVRANIGKTGNPQIDADVSAMAAYNGLMARQIQSLTKLLQGLGQFDVAAVVERGELVLAGSNHLAGVGIEVRNAINSLTDPDKLKKCGLELSPTGQIVSPSLRSILINAKQLAALRQLLK